MLKQYLVPPDVLPPAQQLFDTQQLATVDIGMIADFATAAAFLCLAAVICVYAVRSQENRLLTFVLTAFGVAVGVQRLLEAASIWYPTSDAVEVAKVVATVLTWAAVVGLVYPVVRHRNDPHPASISQRFAEISTRQSAEIHLEQIIQSMSEGVIIADSRGRLQMMNDAAGQLLHSSMDDLQRSEWYGKYRFLKPDGVTEFIPTEMPLAQAIQGNAVSNMDVIVRKPGEADAVMSGLASPIYDVAGELAGGVTIFHDVTRLRKMERDQARHYEKLEKLTTIAIQSSQILDRPEESSYRMLLNMAMNATESSYVCLVILDYQGDFVCYSSSQTPGASPETVSALHTRRVARDSVPEAMHKLLMKFGPTVEHSPHSTPITNTPVANSVSAAIVHRDEGVGWLMLANSPSSYSDDDTEILSRTLSIIGPVVAARIKLDEDEFERSAAETELRQRQQEIEHLSRTSTLGELTAGIAHELNQPLTAIANFAEASERRLAQFPQDEVKKVTSNLQRIRRLTHQSGEVIRRLKDVVRPRSGLNARTELCELIHSTVDLLFVGGDTEQGAIQESHPDGLLWVFVDPVEIQQVLVNLIQNALDATSKCHHPQISVTTSRNEHNEAVVRIIDNGIGLHDIDIDRVFDSFYTKKNEGLGIGLKICHTIIERHSGRITATNNDSGGATFRFTLPLDSHAAG